MVNNSSIQKWDRLEQKQLDQQFINTVIQGMRCSPFEAGALLDTVHKVYGTYFETCGVLKPGQTLFQVLSIDNCPSTPIGQAKQIQVVLTIEDITEDITVREKSGVTGLRRHRLERVANEAFQQGGVLTVEDLAYRLFNCGYRTICRDLNELKKKNIILPLRSVIKDMGRAITHRTVIVKEWLIGKEYSEIARSTHHTVSSVRNYIEKFKRTITLSNEGYDINTISFLVKISAPLAKEYYKLWSSSKIIKHRKDEITDFLKKNSF